MYQPFDKMSARLGQVKKVVAFIMLEQNKNCSLSTLKLLPCALQTTYQSVHIIFIEREIIRKLVILEYFESTCDAV